MKKLKLGIIGMSEGNGHPYSWSAICNGYNQMYMKSCPFPVIPNYLAQESFPDAQIPQVEVTHIWTQEKAISEHVALSSNIPFIVDKPQDMVGQVDGLLLARDDAQTHYFFAEPFLDAGTPIYIDKPLALSCSEAKRIYARSKYDHQIYTTSALSHAPELLLTEELRNKVGRISTISAETPKYWDTYAIHIIEPVLKMLDWTESYTLNRSTQGPQTSISLTWLSGIETTFTAFGSVVKPIQIHITGEHDTITLTFSHTFRAFKTALEKFVGVIRGSEVPPKKDFVLKTIALVEQGRSP